MTLISAFTIYGFITIDISSRFRFSNSMVSQMNRSVFHAIILTTKKDLINKDSLVFQIWVGLNVYIFKV